MLGLKVCAPPPLLLLLVKHTFLAEREGEAFSVKSLGLSWGLDFSLASKATGESSGQWGNVSGEFHLLPDLVSIC